MHSRTQLPWFPLVATLLLAACGGQSAPDGEGSAQLFGTLDQSITAAGVAEVRVTVSASDMPSRTVKLVKTNNQWGGTLGKLPAGTNRTFTAEAFDGGGTLVYAGSVTGVTIAAGQTTAVSITLQEVNPAQPFANAAPVVTSLLAAPASVEPGGVLSLSATAADANAGDVLTYAWSAPVGTFAQPGSLSTSWTAPSVAGNVPLTLTVTDSKGAQGRVTFNANVTAGRGDATVTASLNTWPQVGNITATATAMEVNEPTTVTALASDNDGDVLAYSWAASCPGTWTSGTSAAAQFVPTALPGSNACNNCNLTVTVTDLRNGQPIGGQTTGTLAICVGPRPTASFPPDIIETFQSTAVTSANGSVTFRVQAVDPQSSALSFSWSANTGTLGAANTGADASEVVWTAPACRPAGTTPTLTATVANALGLSASHVFTVTGVPSCIFQPTLGVSTRVTSDGTLWAWGGGRGTPAPVQGLTGITAVFSRFTTMALRQDGTLLAWGYNSLGQIGDGTITERFTPVQVQGLTNVAAMAANEHHSMALRQDGTVWTWGGNGAGQLGDGTTNNRLLPAQVQGLTDVKAIDAGYRHSVALRQDGTVWAWGDNGRGQLGDGTYVPHRTPMQVPGLTNITAIAAGREDMLALRQDGTVWRWGRGNEIGPTPVQVPGLTNVAAISNGFEHYLVLRQDGTVWAWGRNVRGALGDGTTQDRATPVQVQGLTNVTQIVAGQDSCFAVRDDGAVFAWGYNNYAQLGDGTTLIRLTPVRVVGF